MWFELIATGAVGAITMVSAAFYHRDVLKNRKEEDMIEQISKNIKQGRAMSAYVERTFDDMCSIFGYDVSLAKAEFGTHVETHFPFGEYSRMQQRSIEQQIMIGFLFLHERWMSVLDRHLDEHGKAVLQVRVKHAFEPYAHYEMLIQEFGNETNDILELLHGFDMGQSEFAYTMRRTYLKILQERGVLPVPGERKIEANRDFLKEEMDRLSAAKQKEQDMLIEFTTLINHIEAEVEAERLRFEVDGLKMDEWKIGYAEVIEKAATMRGIPFEAKTKHDYEFLYNLDGMDYEAAVIRIGIGAFFVKFGLNTPEAMQKLIAKPVPQHVEFKDFLAFYGHTLYEKPALPEPQVEPEEVEVTDADIEELQEAQFEWSKDPTHIIGLNEQRSDADVLQEMTDAFEEDMARNGQGDWRSYLVDYMNTRVRHDYYNTAAGTAEDADMYHQAMNFVQQERMRLVMLRIQLQKITGVTLDADAWDLSGEIIEALIVDGMAQNEQKRKGSEAEQRHARIQVTINALETERKAFERAANNAKRAKSGDDYIAAAQVMDHANRASTNFEKELAKEFMKSPEAIGALEIEDLTQLNHRLRLEGLENEAKRKKMLENKPKDNIDVLFERADRSQKRLQTDAKHFEFASLCKRCEEHLVTYVKRSYEVYKGARSGREEGIMDSYLLSQNQALTEYVASATLLYQFMQKHQIQATWTFDLPQPVRMLMGRILKVAGVTKETFAEIEAEEMKLLDLDEGEYSNTYTIRVEALKALYQQVLDDDMDAAGQTKEIEGTLYYFRSEAMRPIAVDDMLFLIDVFAFVDDVNSIYDAALLMLHWKKDGEFVARVEQVLRHNDIHHKDKRMEEAMRFYVYGLEEQRALTLADVIAIEDALVVINRDPRLKTIGLMRAALDHYDAVDDRTPLFASMVAYVTAKPKERKKCQNQQTAFAYFTYLFHAWNDGEMRRFADGLTLEKRSDLAHATNHMRMLAVDVRNISAATLSRKTLDRERFTAYAGKATPDELNDMLEYFQEVQEWYANLPDQVLASDVRFLLDQYGADLLEHGYHFQVSFKDMLKVTYRINTEDPEKAMHFFAMTFPMIQKSVKQIIQEK